MNIAGGIAFGLAMLASALLTRILLPLLIRRAILDQPNERSSHSTPTPRGGGIAVVLVAIAGLLFEAMRWPGGFAALLPVMAAVVLLAGVSWLDDLKGLRALPRLAAQIIAATICLWSLNPHPIFMGLLPPVLDAVIAGIGLIWFINLFNFMDGIDGISGVEGVTLGTGTMLVFVLTPSGFHTSALPLFPAILAGAFAGFLIFNWHPAKVFLGDVGSIPTGYLFGCMLLAMAGSGYWAAALILPAYYLADATITLARRLFRGEAPWHAHREHFYQQATASLSHAQVSLRVAAGNVVLIVLAMVSTRGGGFMAAALAGAVTVVAVLLFAFTRAGGAGRSPG